jgi:hypothetical protein
VPANSPKKNLWGLDDPSQLAGSVAASGPQPSVEHATVIPSSSDPLADGERAHPRDCPTVIPAFDPLAYAKERDGRDRALTITNEVELEHARVASMPSDAPPVRPRAASLVEVDVAEEELDSLDDDAQIAILLARLAPMDRVPTLAKTPNELAMHLQDSKAAYLAGFVDGLLPLETIVDVAGLPQLDSLRVLDQMITLGLAVFRA